MAVSLSQLKEALGPYGQSGRSICGLMASLLPDLATPREPYRSMHTPLLLMVQKSFHTISMNRTRVSVLPEEPQEKQQATERVPRSDSSVPTSSIVYRICSPFRSGPPPR